MLLLHTYAPRTVDVEVDLDIVRACARAYQPEVEPTWPLRPELDVISRALDGTDHAPAAVVDALRREHRPRHRASPTARPTRSTRARSRGIT